MNHFLKPWMLVVTGILFNIAAAVITHYFIGVNNQRLNELEVESARFDTLIDGQWRTRTEVQRKGEFLLLLLTQSEAKSNPGIQDILRRQLARIEAQQQLATGLPKNEGNIRFATIEKLTERVSDKIIDSINDTYLEKLELQQQVQPLQEKNALLLSVSIFLQLTGLILVLAKDIFR